MNDITSYKSKHNENIRHTQPINSDNVIFDTVEFLKKSKRNDAPLQPSTLANEFKYSFVHSIFIAFSLSIVIFSISTFISIPYFINLKQSLNIQPWLSFSLVFFQCFTPIFIYLIFKNIIKPSQLISKLSQVGLQFNSDQFNCNGIISHKTIAKFSFNYNEIRSVQLNNQIKTKRQFIRREKILKKAKYANILDSGILSIHLKNGDTKKLLLLDSIYNQQELDDIIIEFKARGVKIVGFDFQFDETFTVTEKSKKKENPIQNTETIYYSASKEELSLTLSRFHNITTVKVKSITFSLLLAVGCTFATAEFSQIESLVLDGLKNYNPFDRYTSDVTFIFSLSLITMLIIFNIIFFLVRNVSRGKFASRYITFYKDQLSYYLISQHSHEQFGYLHLSQVQSVYFLAPIESSKNYKPLGQSQISKLGKTVYEGAPGVLSIKLKSGEIKHFTHMTLLYNKVKMTHILNEFKIRGIDVYDLPIHFSKSKKGTYQPINRSHHYLNW
ncbi:hypothetical protein [Marinicellulosiphila megalodicopiae]|uniref:hypothetical protein n=1 Tax=Marinicellulosiphila megalodicopiae TaxID=2724896 RepID=UPI003BAE19E3